MTEQPKALTPWEAKKTDLENTLSAMKGKIEQALPAALSSERFLRFAAMHWLTTKEMWDVNLKSYVAAVMECSQLGLLPGKARGHVALIPYKGIVTVVPMFKGLIKLLLDAGQYTDVQVEIVGSNDDFHFQRGDKPYLTHTWTLGADRGDPIGGYMVATEKSGRSTFDIVDWAYIQGIKARATANKKSSPWDTDEIEMARKTCLRHGIKYLNLGDQADRFERAVELDNATFEAVTIPTVNTHPTPAPLAAAKQAARIEAMKTTMQPIPSTLEPEQLDELEAAKAKVEAARQAAENAPGWPKLHTCSVPGCPGRTWPAPHNCGTASERCENPKATDAPTEPEPPADMLLPGQEGYEEQEERAALQDEQSKPASLLADSQQASNQAPVWKAPERETRRRRK